MIIILLTVILGVTFITTVMILIMWMSHRGMTISNTKNWNYVNFSTFLREFNKVNWDINPRWTDSRFTNPHSTSSYFHANIIKFNDKGMVLYPWHMPQLFLFKMKLSAEASKKMCKKKEDLWKEPEYVNTKLYKIMEDV
jgi:hypothetical protein